MAPPSQAVEPFVLITSPEDGATGTSNPVIFGRAASDSGQVVVVADGQESVAEINFFGEFSTAELTVPPGVTTRICAQVRGSGPAGEVLAESCISYYAEPGGPYLTIDTPSDGGMTSPNVYVSGSTQVRTTIEIALDGVSITSFEAGNYYYHSLEGLTEGPHTLTVTGTDPYGQTSTVSATFTVDATPPAQPVLVGPSPKKTITTPELTVYGTGEPGTWVEVALAIEDNSPYAEVLVADDGTWQVTLDEILTNYATGKRVVYGISVRGHDDVGNYTPYTTTYYTLRIRA